MHLHILGICGTFMGGVARLAIQKGYTVTGSDQNCYPPMSTQLEAMGVDIHQGFDAEQLKPEPDCVVVGNALSRGIPAIEAMLNSNQKYLSGPQWLKENILHDKWVIAVSGTHGKTSTASMVTWILEANGYNPGFLIGGVLENFSASARYTDSPFFVVEADEYDTAFFDKRSKFVHYRARTTIINNLEFDHADIFDDLAAIENQFHHLVRTIPQNGIIIHPQQSEAINRVLERGCWSPTNDFSVDKNDAYWFAKKLSADGSQCEVFYQGELQGELNWSLIGDHNVNNALAAIAAAYHVGVKPCDAVKALASFKNVKRRMELRGEINQIRVFDDFAHHPTAIASTVAGLRNQVNQAKIIAIVDLRSNTMKMGVHKDRLLDSVKVADEVIFHIPESVTWDFSPVDKVNYSVMHSAKAIAEKVSASAQKGDNLLVMSNGGFDGIHLQLLDLLARKFSSHEASTSVEH
ncbi:UDP-N-acetylmuramate:L-alanyl-gamma-D-glutamyl-meso-diaminopimelate ligase [Aliikangiella sp. IMCC44653]